MASDPHWDDIFRSPSPTAPQQGSPGAVPPPAAGTQNATAASQPRSRRELREQTQPRAASSGRGAGSGRKKKRGNWGWIIALTVVFALVAGGGVYVYATYGDKIREVLGMGPAIDYTSSGNGEDAIVVIQPGDIGSDVAKTLHAEGVTLTYRAFYDLLLENPDVMFEPGSYLLQKEMSAAAALAALKDPASRLQNQVTIPEGVSANAAFELIAAGTDISLEDLTAAAANYTQFGVPANAPSIEGFLFPATYTFDPGTTAVQAVQLMVDTMFSRLDGAGVAPETRFDILNMAALVQRESGPKVEDMAKIASVFQNRLDRGMLLQSDATVAYGTGNTHTVWTDPEERADASNLYNTYANPGMPIGPIGLPGMDAINAAISPAAGTWLYFVPIDLSTGETVFSNTLAEHDAAAKKLFAWCRASEENKAYCA